MTEAAHSKIVTLPIGYEGQDGNKHTRVVIGKRLCGADLMEISDSPESEGQTYFQLMLTQAAITEFGTLPIPVSLSALLSLKRPDRDALAEAYAEFTRATGEGRTFEKLSKDTIRLAFGVEIDGAVYDRVTFGNLLSGYDEADGDNLPGWRRVCFLLGKQIGGLAQSEGGATLGGPLAPEVFEGADASDIFKLQEFATEWVNSFRL